MLALQNERYKNGEKYLSRFDIYEYKKVGDIDG